MAQLPVIILTNAPQSEAIADGYQSDANAYLVKPFEFPVLVKAVGRAGAGWLIVDDSPVR